MSAIPWSKAGARYIVETSGQGRQEKEVRRHLGAGGYRVVVTEPVAGVPTLIMGANEEAYNPDMKVTPASVARCSPVQVVSAGCSTSSSLAPLAGLLHTKFGITGSMVTAVGGRGEGGTGVTTSGLGVEDTLGEVVPGIQGRLGGLGVQVRNTVPETRPSCQLTERHLINRVI